MASDCLGGVRQKNGSGGRRVEEGDVPIVPTPRDVAVQFNMIFTLVLAIRLPEVAY